MVPGPRHRPALLSRAGRRLPLIVAVASLVAGLIVLGAAWLSAGGTGPPPPAPAAPTGATTTASPIPPGPRQLTILGAGDILSHPPVWEQAQADAGGGEPDFSQIFAGLSDAVSAADLAICHLETPLAAAAGPYLGWPRFSAPPQLASALVEVGYDACSTASNHTLDQGEEGVRRTIDTLEEAGLIWAGSARSAEEAARPRVIEVPTGDGRTVAVGHLSYTFGFNGLQRPPGREWIANLIDTGQIKAQARAAREAGAEIVVLSLHWGEEYRPEPTAGQVAQAEELLGPGDIDLILGHHAHVVQPVELVAGRWVFYGLGNQLARHAEPLAVQREGVMARVTFVEQDGGWVVSDVVAVPTWVELAPEIRLVDLSAAVGDADLPDRTRAAYQEAYDRIAATLHSRDAGAAGLRLGAGSGVRDG